MRASVLLPVIAFTLAGFAIGCGDDDGPGEDIGPASSVKVMTRNLYLGADLTSVVSTMTLDEIPGRVAAFWAAVKDSDYPARAKRLAEEIATERPDLVGLQEVERLRTQTPGDFSFAAPAINATTVAIDFLALLLDELTARGASYRVAVEAVHTDAELPASTTPGGPTMDLRLTDSDVILVREDVTYTNQQGKNFQVLIPFKVGGAAGVPVSILRGWASVDATIDNARFTFVTSHLEIGGQAAIFQEAQANELVKTFGAATGALILAGDFNSPADRSATQSYAFLTKSFQDAWPAVRMDAGFTCCTDLRSPTFTGKERIDLVLMRGRVRARSVEIVGADPDKRTPSGLWPSDHAGVSATLDVGKN